MGFAPGRCVEETERAHPVTLKTAGACVYAHFEWGNYTMQKSLGGS